MQPTVVVYQNCNVNNITVPVTPATRGGTRRSMIWTLESTQFPFTLGADNNNNNNNNNNNEVNSDNNESCKRSLTCAWMLEILDHENSNSLTGTLNLLSNRRKPSSLGCRNIRAWPLPPAPRAVLPTRWMYSYMKTIVHDIEIENNNRTIQIWEIIM